MMNETTQKLTEWAVNRIKRDYPDDVALLVAVKGHSVGGDGHGECFDYFVPANERGNGLSLTFIVGGVGYDLYPRSWERMERTAALDDWATLCLGNATILYSRSPEDEARFGAIREKLAQNLGDNRYVLGKALERLDVAMDLYRTMMFESKLYQLRQAAGYIFEYLASAVFYLNGTYEKDWTRGRIPALSALPALPEHFTEYYGSILTAQTGDALKELAHASIASFRAFIAGFRPDAPAERGAPDYQALADWYHELSLTWRRLRLYCAAADTDAAFVEACHLQSELSIVCEEFGLGEMDLLGSYDACDLSPLAARAAVLEARIVSEIRAHGATLRSYDTIGEFLSQNP